MGESLANPVGKGTAEAEGSMKADTQDLFAKLPHLLEEIRDSASAGAYRGAPNLKPGLQALAWLAADVMGDGLKPHQSRLAAAHLSTILESYRALQDIYEPREKKNAREVEAG